MRRHWHDALGDTGHGKAHGPHRVLAKEVLCFTLVLLLVYVAFSGLNDYN